MASDEIYAPILALARAGAVSRALVAFADAGLDEAINDPKALTLKGRMLKDEARKANGDAQTRLYLRSTKAYADAAALAQDSYPLINAATMSMFAGQTGQMESQAKQVMALLHSGAGAGETPYWHEATKAEALLLLKKRSEAEAALVDAVKHAPEAWEDHATTLRQFRAILRHRGQPDNWLAAYAPPGSIFFKGMMGISPDDHKATDAINRGVGDSGARFAYGALAAGADILIAEAVMRNGGELHLILPVIPSAFKAQSVTPYGDHWSQRFDALFEQATSVEVVDNDDRLSVAAIDLAAAVAKGRAIENAARLESEAFMFEVADKTTTQIGNNVAHRVTVRRTAANTGNVHMAERQMAWWIASDIAELSGDLQSTSHAAVNIIRIAEPEGIKQIIQRLRQANVEATFAIHAAITDDDILADRDALRLERLVQTATAGTIIASANAAMLLKAIYPALWTEPLGELPDASGAFSVYAVGQVG